jgi:hypothetical protein
VIERRVLDESKFQTGFDADAGVMCDLIEKGIVDPAKVTRSARRTRFPSRPPSVDQLPHHEARRPRTKTTARKPTTSAVSKSY